MGLKGQTFIIGTIIFAGFLFMMMFNYVPDTGRETVSPSKIYFQDSMSMTSDAFNNGLENGSTEEAKREVYMFEERVERFTDSRNIDYRSYTTLVFPEKGSLYMVNFEGTETELNITFNGGSKQTETLEGYSFKEKTFTPGTAEINFTYPGGETDGVFSTPGFLKFGEMETEEEIWRNTARG